jgi:ADP-ribose/FAD diphosphatase
MDYCSCCGRPNEQRVPPGEDRERSVCTACGTIHYQNPRMVVGCVIEQAGKLLLCKRAIDPRRGYWTLPAGFLELGESAMEGAARETREEAAAEVRIVAPYAHFDVPHIGQAYILYRAELLSDFAPGPESLEVELHAPADIPWGQLAFPVVHFALRFFIEDIEQGRYRSHHAALVREDGQFVLRDVLSATVL